MERRDFLNGVALVVPAAFLRPREILGLGATDAEAYPPALTGMRGSHSPPTDAAIREAARAVLDLLGR